MKSLLPLVLVAASTFSISVSAHAIGLKSFYGRTVQRGNVWTCVYENRTGGTQDMKYVVFSFESFSGDSASIEVQNRIDEIVQSGETLTSSTDHVLGTDRVNFCKYLAR